MRRMKPERPFSLSSWQQQSRFWVVGKKSSRLYFWLTVGDVILHSSPRINLEFLRIDRSSQSTIESPGILSLGVTFGIINVFGGKIAAESFRGDFKFGGSVSMGYHQFVHILCRKAEGTSLPRKPRIMTILRIVWRFVLESPAVSTA
jgi:hypothetical protein